MGGTEPRCNVTCGVGLDSASASAMTSASQAMHTLTAGRQHYASVRRNPSQHTFPLHTLQSQHYYSPRPQFAKPSHD